MEIKPKEEVQIVTRDLVENEHTFEKNNMIGPKNERYLSEDFNAKGSYNFDLKRTLCNYLSAINSWVIY